MFQWEWPTNRLWQFHAISAEKRIVWPSNQFELFPIDIDSSARSLHSDGAPGSVFHGRFLHPLGHGRFPMIPQVNVGSTPGKPADYHLTESSTILQERVPPISSLCIGYSWGLFLVWGINYPQIWTAVASAVGDKMTGLTMDIPP